MLGSRTGTLAAVVACGEAGDRGDIQRIGPAVADHPEAGVAEVAAGFDAFDFALLNRLRAERDEPNVVCSPLSAAAPSLVTAGAGGETLGIERAFTPDSDFTPMSPRDPWLGGVAQNAVIEVDESGTEAAAVTGAVMQESARPICEVVVDRRSAFAVRDTHTGASLFLGVIGDPTA